MKKFLQILSLFLVSILYGQQISDYQYILVPEEFKNAKANKYDLALLLKSKLKAKKFNIISENSPESKNMCEYLKAEISDTGNMFTNKVRIDFKDCYDKSIATLDGKSNTKDLEQGMQEALKNAMMNIPVSNPVKNEVTVQKESALTNTSIKRTEIATKEILPPSTNKAKSNPQKSEVYSNGILTLNKILLSNGEFILADPSSSVPYGIFKPSTKKDTYRVQLSDGTTTLGYLEDGKIVIEKSNSDGSLRTEVFGKE